MNIALPLVLISTMQPMQANRLLEGRGLVPVPNGCAALTCLQGYSCCDDATGGAYCCIQSESIDICSLPTVVGPCTADKTRFYFDSTEQICKPFIYGGCQGNKNNFKTFKSCVRRCGDSEYPSTTSYVDDRCSLAPERGPCKAKFPRFYYDSDSGKCKLFFYGGCEGNGNRFGSKKECIHKCEVGMDSTTETPISTQEIDICTLPPQTGLCRGAFPRFFYNHKTERCESFMYGGCGGNGNNFKTITECIASCDVFDWSGALPELNERKALWEANGILKYRYHFQKWCFCMQCDVAGKYIEVKEDAVTLVEFDADAPPQCDEEDIRDPIDDNYMTINGLFDIAIAHVTYGMNANCDDPNELDAICGGGIDIQYDEILNYPTFISLEYGQLIADAGGSYTMRCLTVIDITEGNENALDNYANECDESYDVSTTDICSKEIGEACESNASNDQCCDGVCSTAALDNSVWICCYTDRHTNIVCENDGVCCEGFLCDSTSKLCVEI